MHIRVLLLLYTINGVFTFIVTPYARSTFRTVRLLHPHAWNKSTMDTKTATILKA